MEEKLTPAELQTELLLMFVPEDILAHFVLQRIIKKSSSYTVELDEKADRTPVELKGKIAVLDGYLNIIELQSFPIQAKKCYLRLRRRRWKEQGTDGKQSYWNDYDFAAEGTKATKAFGDFLKEIHS